MSRLTDAQREALRLLLEDEVWVTTEDIPRAVHPRTIKSLEQRGLWFQGEEIRGEPSAVWLLDDKQRAKAEKMLADNDD